MRAETKRLMAIAIAATLLHSLGLLSANALPGNQEVLVSAAAKSQFREMPLALRFSSNVPEVEKVSSSLTPQNQLTLRLTGNSLSEVRRVLVDGVPTSFYLNSDNLITARSPVEAKPGDVRITIQGAFGSLEIPNYLFIPGADVPSNPNIAVSSNPGEISIKAKDLTGKRLSVRVGSQWRVIEEISNNLETVRFIVEPRKTITVMVYLDKKIAQIAQVQTG